ncbi:hydrogenase maturation protease [Polyangium sorediatum]|uniref:Hydrogenase maturation protease n=1 Tax=Polyangium sorediatum TaxID=889274 RepID=A0ABT6P6I3_9BACT|nr:hydrogenase maturation protease [Polyangium sorediatum]MDI1436236.1 hydrogenase maturation protease [Polyangium sorediatum]
MIAIGQRAAGDDGVGPAVLDALRAQGTGEGVDLCEVDEPSALLPLLEDARRVILVDAALGGGGGAGTVHVLAEETLDVRDIAPISTHGLTVGQVLGLARALAPDKVCRDISIVAVSVERPACLSYGLSPEALAAVPRAVEAVRNLVAGAS